jgi:hypothetical protein
LEEELMKILKSLIPTVVAVFALAASGTAFAQCTAKPDAYTLQKKGQGNLVCEDFAGPNGVLMRSAEVCDNVTASISGATASWSINPMTGPCAGDIAIVDRADGTNCVYQYRVDKYADTGLSAPGNNNIKTVTVCTDQQLIGQFVDPGSDSIISTGDNCSFEAPSLQNAINSGEAGLDIAFAVGTPPDQSSQTLALCSNQRLVNGVPTLTQVQCVDRCETPIGYPDVVGKNAPDCTGPFPDGRLPIACRRCATSGEPDGLNPTGPNIPEGTPFCWELADRVAVTDGSSVEPPSPPLYDPQLTFRPHKFVSGGQFEWDRVDGTICYKITGQTAGGYPYSFYVPEGCPCDPQVSTCKNINL